MKKDNFKRTVETRDTRGVAKAEGTFDIYPKQVFFFN